MRAVTLSVLVAFIVPACGGARAVAPAPVPAALTPPTHVLLRFHPRAGDHFGVVLDQRTEMKPDSGSVPLPPTNVVLRTFMHDSVLPSSADTFRIRQVFDSIVRPDTSSSGLSGLSQLPDTRGVNGVLSLDDRMVVRSASFTDRNGKTSPITEAMAEGARQFSTTLPTAMVAPGDTWSTTTDAGFSKMMPGMDSVRLTMWFRLDSIIVSKADTSVRITVQAAFPTAPINISNGNLRLVMFMTGGMSGVQWFSVTRGAVIRDSMGGTVHIAATSPALPSALRMTMQQQYTTRMVPP